MKKFMIPAVLVLMGTGAAFATKANSNSAKALVNGYRIDIESGECFSTNQQCETTGSEPCQWTADPNVRLVEQISANPTMCGEELFKVQ